MSKDGSPSARASPSSTHGGSNSIPVQSNSAPSDFLPGLPPSTATPLGWHGDKHGDKHGQDGDVTATTTAAVDAHGRPLNRRSCVTCRKRKVKCDKAWPCTNCNRAHIECVFPAPGRAPRKPRKLGGDGRDKELLERLRKLESVVKGMGAEVPGGEATTPEGHTDAQGGTGHTEVQHGTGQAAEDRFQSKTRWIEAQQTGRFENRFGRLVVNDGKSRYINNSFWANLSNEVEDLKGILNQSSDDDDDHPSASPETGPPPSTHHAFVFGFSSHSVDMLALHPPPGQIKDYWAIYKDRVDPLCKILHVPTVEGTILTAASHLANLSRAFECLLFAIYYGATTSLTPEDCVSKLGEEKAVLLTRYRFAVEQALARANFLTTEESVVLQAFVIFLICLRRNSDARVIWTLTGLVVRIAQTLGIHRDGSHFGLSPFEVEMRSRLWWQVCILDTRASEDHGCDPTIVEQSFDTQMPRNLNDEDITPDMKEFPPERKGCTIMSFCLLRFEVANTFRRLHYIPPGPPKACNEFYQSVTLHDKERWITECHKRLEERYLQHCDMSVPLFWVTATVARLMMSKMWLMVYHPFQRQDGGASLSPEIKEKLFITSLENMEYSLLLESESRTMKWGWLFRTYIQWHALAFTLSELCHRTTGDMVERAWKAVERTASGRWDLELGDDTNSGHLWRPLKKLYRKAKAARAHGRLHEEQQMLPQVPGGGDVIPSRHYSPNANPMFGHAHRASVTRAPLSQAQLQRFHQGPSFGTAPLDKHEMLRSPKPPEANQGESRLPPDPPRQQPPQQQQASLTTATDPLSPFSAMAPLIAPLSCQTNPHNMTFGDNFLSATSAISFGNNNNNNNNISVDQSTTGPTQQDQLPSNRDLDPTFPLGDGSSGMDWQDWDHLVRQFGMDVDSAPNPTNPNSNLNINLSGGGGGGMDWSGVNFDDTAAALNDGSTNQKSAFGMSGGEWY